MTHLEETQAQALQDIKDAIHRDATLPGIRAPRELRDEVIQITMRLEEYEQNREWGITYATETGHLYTEWGYTRSPVDQIDPDGEINIGKREWVKAYEILSRPNVVQTSEWKSDDCPW